MPAVCLLGLPPAWLLVSLSVLLPCHCRCGSLGFLLLPPDKSGVVSL